MKISTLAIGLLVLALTSGKKLRSSAPGRSLQEPTNPPPDPYLFLENVKSDESIAWVEEQNAATIESLQSYAVFDEIYERLSDVYTSPDNLPSFEVRGNFLYNFWRDGQHERGIWRRTTLEEYKKDVPVWETILDIDALSKQENENWVFQGTDCLPSKVAERCLLRLSRGGSDASTYREFDLDSMLFVEDGFVVPQAKSYVAWKDENAIWVSTDFGEGSLTFAGLPRIVNVWERGTELGEAKRVYETTVEKIGASGNTLFTPEANYNIIGEINTFFSIDYYYVKEDEETTIKIDIPADAELKLFFKGYMMVTLRSDWNVDESDTVYKAGSLLAIDFESFINDGGSNTIKSVFTPSDRVSLKDRDITRNEDYLIYGTLDNVSSRMYRVTIDEAGNWLEKMIDLPGLGTSQVVSPQALDDADFFISYEDFVTPASYYSADKDCQLKKLKSEPDVFDTEGVTVDQYHAASKDGTLIPYFIIKPANYVEDGNNPTLLYAYGGFAISQVPRYQTSVGPAWIERGGVYVVANIRGGGEFGPEWHQAAVQENHQTNFDDFIAVAEDLIARKVTSPDHLGIRGGSQGGLLVGGTVVQRPDLFGAVACHVPLLDMRRYTKLLVGATWISEYGDPDTDDWENFISSWSPYQNVQEGVEYPTIFFQTNTNDDRVHPAHARKMAAKMLGFGHSILFFENTEGGHGGGASLNQRAYLDGITYTYLWKMLGISSASSDGDAFDQRPTFEPTMMESESNAASSGLVSSGAAVFAVGVSSLILIL